jgi:hypothetical protein
MNLRKIYLMSPREPSGATWLINCFLELGIKTYRKTSPDMWIQHGDQFILSSHEEILKKWLPALWDHPKFNFSNAIEVEWAHEWPTEYHDKYKVIYFTRDPRDSLYSRYKRESPDQAFKEFILFPDVNTLLDKAHNWRLFNLSWMQHPNNQVFRFEDYKENPLKVLTNVLDFLELGYSEADVQRALSASTFERAAEAETKYRNKYPEDRELINRSGTAGEWKSGGIDQECLTYIEQTCADAMLLQDYECKISKPEEVNYSSLIGVLPFLQGKKLSPAVHQQISGADISDVALGFATSLQSGQLRRARLRQYEVAWLLGSLSALSHAKGFNSLPGLKAIYREFGLDRNIFRSLRYRLSLVFGRLQRLFG